MHVMWNYTAGSFFDFLSLLNIPLIPPHSCNQDQFPLKLGGLESCPEPVSEGPGPTLHFRKPPACFQQWLFPNLFARYSLYLVIKTQSKSYKKFTLGWSKGARSRLLSAFCRQ